MAKDYFQDIKLSPEEPPRTPQGKRPPSRPRAAVPPARPMTDDEDDEEPVRINVHEHAPEPDIEPEPQSPTRSIRNVNLPTRPRGRIDAGEGRGAFGGGPPLPPRRPAGSMGGKKNSRRFLWIIVFVVVLITVGAGLIASRPTTVTVTPRSQNVTFDGSTQFTAYPAEGVATGTLSYMTVTTTVSASTTVASTGTTQADQKASGNIVVYNDYSASSVKLIANTRFQTPDGLIFRTPDAIVVPGKSGSTPGQINVTVIADQGGASYNIGPVSRFTVPGLQSTAAMYSNIYAQSTGSMSGGSSGEEPVVASSTEQTAITQLQSQLQTKVAQVAALNTTASTTALAGLAQVTFQELPVTSAAGGEATLAESAEIQMPVFPADAFASTVGQAVSADVGTSGITLVPGNGFAASSADSASSTLGEDPVDFTLAGGAQLIWQIDTQALTQALAGKNEAAFTTIVNGFSGIQEATSRIEPFWKNTFPTNPASIKVIVQIPAASS